MENDEFRNGSVIYPHDGIGVWFPSPSPMNPTVGHAELQHKSNELAHAIEEAEAFQKEIKARFEAKK